jgi:hypothetical protein
MRFFAIKHRPEIQGINRLCKATGTATNYQTRMLRQPKWLKSLLWANASYACTARVSYGLGRRDGGAKQFRTIPDDNSTRRRWISATPPLVF